MPCFFGSPWFRSCWGEPPRLPSVFPCGDKSSSTALNMETSLRSLASPGLAWEGWWDWRPLISEGLPREWCWQMSVMRSWKRHQHQMTWSVSLYPGHVSNPEPLPCTALGLWCVDSTRYTWPVTALGKAGIVSPSPQSCWILEVWDGDCSLSVVSHMVTFYS